MLFLRLLGPAELFAADGLELRDVLAQPKRLALLSYLTIARPFGFHRRDTLLGLFWPELDQARARAALRQALYTLRRSLPEGVLVSRGTEIRVDPERLDCDVLQFNRKRVDDPEGAVELYRGDLLQGLYLSDAPEFERWLEEERERLKREAAEAAWSATRRVRATEPERAVAWARRAVLLDPFNEDALRRLMLLFAESGQRASALQIYSEFERVLGRDLETAPSAATQQLAEQLRAPPRIREAHGGPVAIPELELPQPATQRAGKVRSWWRTATVVTAVAVFGLIGTHRLMQALNGSPVIAVGEIRGLGGTDTLTASLRDMLATNLARVPAVDVISSRLLLERSENVQHPQPLADAARALGASRMLEGSLDRTQSGDLRLSLQWVELSSGRTTPAADVSERTIFALVDAATGQLARKLGRVPPKLEFAQVSTSSFTAYRLYEEGLRAYYRGERAAAARFFADAVADDSMFAMAQWYYSRVVPYPGGFDVAARALRVAAHASDRERLSIQAAWLAETDDPRTLAVAETLAIRYPLEPDGHLILGRAKLYSGDFMGALPHFRRVIHMDTGSLRNPGLRCRACDAISETATAFAFADSAPAVLRFTRAWVREQPQSSSAWMALAGAFDMNGQSAEALRARERALALPPPNYLDQFNIELFIRTGDFALADSLLLARMRFPDRETRSSALWIYTLSLRNQQRYGDALNAAHEYYQVNRGEPGNNPIYARGVEAQVLLDMGRPRDAALLYEEIARAPYTQTSPARNARSLVGGLARAAEAYYRAHDSTSVKRLLGEMERWAPQTTFVFARYQHLYIRGLLYLARNDTTRAITELTRAITSPTHGSLRVNYHLAKTLIAAGRPTEALPYLDAALRGPVGGGGYLITHRELHELAALAWRTASAPARAARHEAWLERLGAYRRQPHATIASPDPL